MKHGIIVEKWEPFRYWSHINELFAFKVPLKFVNRYGRIDDGARPFVPYANYNNLLVPDWVNKTIVTYYTMDTGLSVLDYLTKMWPDLRRSRCYFSNFCDRLLTL